MKKDLVIQKMMNWEAKILIVLQKLLLKIYFTHIKNLSFRKKKKLGLVSVRAGNVIGGGDWSKDRIIPDFIKSIIHNQKFTLRSPKATRPWQHIFDLLNGYLILSKKIYGRSNYNGSWNFGPAKGNVTVKEVVLRLVEIMGVKKRIFVKKDMNLEETGLLSLKINKSKKYLKWKPKLSFIKTLKMTAHWYQCYIYDKKNIDKLSKKQFTSFFYD